MMLLVTYRITKYADNRFAVEVRNEDYGSWRTTGEYSTRRQADVEKVRLQKLAGVTGSQFDSI